ncbi:DUF4168 domain-containing protein [Marinimicrobium sp. C2-29]|uniref:DUF4168 domain-containing protein n=1 Tax=Marinimicrobium sp. C2-29 TaxID=3139825 RepID=UPI00313A381F
MRTTTNSAVKHPVLALLAAAGLLFGAATVSAQGGAPQQGGQQAAPGAQPQAEQIEVSDKEVEGFVDAYMAVQGVNQEYTQKLQEVEDPEKATELQQEAQGEMQSAVDESGLSIEKYQQIANQAGQDEELRGKIEEALAARVE